MTTTRIWGPHSSGLGIFGLHIGAATEVDLGEGGSVPGSLSITFSAQPQGTNAEISPVQNGATGSIAYSPGITLSGTVNNCRAVPAADGAPAHFIFQFSIRAAGSVKVGPFQLPVDAQIDAFDVVLDQG